MEAKWTSTETIRINNKTVQLWRPYKVAMSELVGRDEAVRKVLAAWMGRSSGMHFHPLLVGDPGVGKNRIAYECARICSKDLYILPGHEDITADELLCVVRFSDDPDRKMDYVLSNLTTAMVKGGVIFLDEIGKIRPNALASIAPLLDERRTVDPTMLAEQIHADRGFRFIAGTNWADLYDNSLPEFIRSRLWPVIPIDYPEEEEIERIIRSRFAVIHSNGKQLISRFWELWHELKSDLPPTPRQAIQLFGYAINLADLEQVQKGVAMNIEVDANPSLTLRETHLEEAFATFSESIAKEASWKSSH